MNELGLELWAIIDLQFTPLPGREFPLVRLDKHNRYIGHAECIANSTADSSRPDNVNCFHGDLFFFQGISADTASEPRFVPMVRHGKYAQTIVIPVPRAELEFAAVR